MPQNRRDTVPLIGSISFPNRKVKLFELYMHACMTVKHTKSHYMTVENFIELFDLVNEYF